ncbi:MAG: hypothetical protein IKZ86_05075 [Spirochaetaceae bacterium]|nr:hypothetical protein [Spirochaetaceae bacterium]
MKQKKQKVKKPKDPRPFAQRHPRWNTFFGLIILILLGVGVFFFVKFIGKGFVKFIQYLIELSSKLDAVIIVALITAIVTIISGVVSKIIDYKQKRREYLSQKREEPYAEFINVYYKMQEKISKGESYSQEEMFDDVQKFQKKLMLWGSNRVIKAWIDFRTNASPDGSNVLYYMENILYAIRKDMGYKNLGKGKLLSMSINDFILRR